MNEGVNEKANLLKSRLADKRLITPDKLSDDNIFSIFGTSDRSGAGDRYIIRMFPEMRRKLDIGDWAAVIFEHPMSEAAETISDIDKSVSGYLVVHCRVADLTPENFDDSEASLTTVQIDQTLRNALGIPFSIGSVTESGLSVWVYPLDPRLKLGGLVERLTERLGRRFQYFRVCKAAVPDIEKDLVRIPGEYFPVLGITPGSTIVCERPVIAEMDSGKITSFGMVQTDIKAFVAQTVLIDERAELEKYYPGRYFPAQQYLYDKDRFVRKYNLMQLVGTESNDQSMPEPDIPRIFADLHFRNSGEDDLNAPMTPLTAICVRRNLWEAFRKEILASAFSFAISLPAFLLGLMQIYTRDDIGTAFALLILLLLAAVPAAIFALIWWRVWNQVR